MPWKTINVMEQRLQFISLARKNIYSFKKLCKLFNISRTTGYKWLYRSYSCSLINAVKNKSRRPKKSPRKTKHSVENAIIQLRKQYPDWGARKIAILFKEQYPQEKIPAERTINRIIVRNNLLNEYSPQGVNYTRFEAANPNDLWQMDYKGEFQFSKDKRYCYPFDIVDDHSRFNIVLDAHTAISSEQVQQSMRQAFEENGLPEKILVDHGSCWYTAHAEHQPWTRLVVWLMRLGIELIYARIRHPQTSGKIERFHRTLKQECIGRNKFTSFEHIQNAFDNFRVQYNNIRPHDALNLQRPIQRYVKSNRLFPTRLPTIIYESNAIVRNIDGKGRISFKKRKWPISKALIHLPVELKQSSEEVFDIYFMKTYIRSINLKL